MMSLMRSRWAAIGAAVAVVLGAGGVTLVGATIDSGDKPVTVFLDEPCRIRDTRASKGIGGRTTPLGAAETYDVAGTGPSGDCNVPAGAVGLITNVTAVGATSNTNLRFFPAGSPLPGTSNMNPRPGSPPTPNSVTVGLNGSGEFSIYNAKGTVDVIVDVAAYLVDHNHDDRYYTRAEVDAAVAAAIAAAIADLDDQLAVVAAVSTLAGSGTPGTDDGTGIAAKFNNPIGVAVDGSGNVYVADTTNNLIRKITPAGVVSTFAGDGSAGFVDSANGLTASFDNPYGIAIDSSGNLYVADTGNHSIRKITPAGAVTTLAGDGSAGSNNATGSSATFDTPYGVAVDTSGNLYVADSGNFEIRKIDTSLDVTTLAGNGIGGIPTDGNGASAIFDSPRGVAVDTAGNVYVADTNVSMIRKVTPSGDVTTLAGDGTSGSADGNGLAARFNRPRGVAVDSSGNIYVGDTGNHKIRKIDTSLEVTTVAGTGSTGFANGAGTSATFNSPYGVAIDTSGDLYVADLTNHMIRKIT